MSKKNYINNLKFSLKVAIYMSFSICFILLNGLIPFSPIPKLFTIEGITHKMKKWDAYLKIKQAPRKKK
tara:strand:+ start:77 stop:283 length:207 start_codon:yes stop_codon:yes gene_type:complete